jgi:hypothetical protein
MVTARAADVTALSVTGQIPRLTSWLEPIASLACRLACTPSVLHRREAALRERDKTGQHQLPHRSVVSAALPENQPAPELPQSN